MINSVTCAGLFMSRLCRMVSFDPLAHDEEMNSAAEVAGQIAPQTRVI
jgi:hypothetical protein